MKVVHLVTFVSQNGAFGGPVAVAINQLTELKSRGWDTQLLAGWDGKASSPVGVGFVGLSKTIRLFPYGFVGLISPGVMWRVLRTDPKESVLHVHLARDLISMSAAALFCFRGGRVIAQTHGMIMPKSGFATRFFDRILTRYVLRKSHRVLALTKEEAAGILEVSDKKAKVQLIRNGIVPNPIALLQDQDPNDSNDVLFLARLHSRKRVLAFAEAASIVNSALPGTRFSVVGPDEGDLYKLEEYIKRNGNNGNVHYEGPLETEKVAERIASASVYVLPSFGEIFPMTVLESLTVGTPVVTTFDSGIAGELDELGAAVITDGTPRELADAIHSILTSASRGKQLAHSGILAITSTFGIAPVVNDLVRIYKK